jgi:GNAT superfamily N-acetyltransferase
MSTEIIKQLKYEDEEQILNLIKASILNGDELHVGELLPTNNNVFSFYKLEVFPLIFEEEPVLGCFKQKSLIGLSCCSTKINHFYSLRQKTATGVITIVHPNHRRKGIGTELRLRLGKDLRKRGIEKFIFDIKDNNKASLNNAQKIAAQLDAEAQLIAFKFEASTDVF